MNLRKRRVSALNKKEEESVSRGVTYKDFARGSFSIAVDFMIMPPLLLCHGNEDRHDIWVIQWFRWTDFPPFLVKQAKDGRVETLSSITNRKASFQINEVAVNTGCERPLILESRIQGALKAETDTL